MNSGAIVSVSFASKKVSSTIRNSSLSKEGVLTQHRNTIPLTNTQPSGGCGVYVIDVCTKT